MSLIYPASLHCQVANLRRLLGREHEFAELKEAADGFISDRGSIVTIIGEAGLGKSRLAYDLRDFESYYRATVLYKDTRNQHS